MRKPRHRARSSVLVRSLPASLLVALAGCAAPVIGGIPNPGPATLPPPPIAEGLLVRGDAGPQRQAPTVPATATTVGTRVPVAATVPAATMSATAVAGAVAAPVTTVAAGAGEARAQYRAARDEFHAGRTRAAIARLRRVRELDPSMLEAANALAVLLAEAGDLEGARAELRAVLALRPEDPVARANLAILDDTSAPAAASPPAAGGPVAQAETAGDPVGAAREGPTDSRAAPGPTRIELHNASHHAGLAVRVSKRLTPDGASARTLRTGNWTRFNLLRTEIHHRPGAGDEAARIARLLGLPPSALRATPNVPDDVDLRIILGHDAGRAGDMPRPQLSARSART